MARPTPADFIETVKRMPRFVEALAKDPAVWGEHLRGIEVGIQRITELADEEPAIWLDRFDEVCTLLGNERLSIKQRLLGLGELLEKFRPAQRRMN
jgi:hypothetical protein